MGSMGADRPEGYIPIGRIDRVRGLIGEVVVTVHADDPERMAELDAVYLTVGGGAYRPLRVEGFKRLHDRAVIRLEGIRTPEDARDLVGKDLFIPREASTPAPEGRYYAYQLEGMPVRLADGSPIGVIREILRPGPQSLLVIEGSKGEILIPFAKEIVVDVDLQAGEVTIDPPEGLLDLNEPAGAGGRSAGRRPR